MNTTTLNMTTLDGNVIIKKGGGGTPTPPSGGESASTIEYLDVRGLEEGHRLVLAASAILTKGDAGYKTILPYSITLMDGGNWKSIDAISIDLSMEVNFIMHKITMVDLLISAGFDQSVIDSIPRLTKEQFYSLD